MSIRYDQLRGQGDFLNNPYSVEPRSRNEIVGVSFNGIVDEILRLVIADVDRRKVWKLSRLVNFIADSERLCL